MVITKHLNSNYQAPQVSLTKTTPDQTFAVQMCVNMQGKLNGLAVRVPLTNSSITDCVFEVEKATSVEEVNKLLKVC